MKNRKIYFYSALFITLLVVILLITGSSILNIGLDSNDTIPLGTFITWLGMIALPLTVYWGTKNLRTPNNQFNNILGIALKIILVLGILWVPISYLLAGNLAFSFSEKVTFQGGQAAMRWFWRLSYGIGIGSLSVLIIYWISLLFKKN